MVPCVCLLFVIVVFPDHTHLLFLGSDNPLYLLYMNHKTSDLETWFAGNAPDQVPYCFGI